MKFSIIALALSLIMIGGSAQTSNSPQTDKPQVHSTSPSKKGSHRHHFRGGKKKQGEHGHKGHGRHKGRHRHHRSH